MPSTSVTRAYQWSDHQYSRRRKVPTWDTPGTGPTLVPGRVLASVKRTRKQLFLGDCAGTGVAKAWAQRMHKVQACSKSENPMRPGPPCSSLPCLSLLRWGVSETRTTRLMRRPRPVPRCVVTARAATVRIFVSTWWRWPTSAAVATRCAKPNVRNKKGVQKSARHKSARPLHRPYHARALRAAMTWDRVSRPGQALEPKNEFRRIPVGRADPQRAIVQSRDRGFHRTLPSLGEQTERGRNQRRALQVGLSGPGRPDSKGHFQQSGTAPGSPWHPTLA